NLLGLEREWHPGVGIEFDRAPERARRAAADPQRHALLDRRRIHGHAREGKMHAVVFGLSLAERGLDRADRVLCALAATLERASEHRKLFLERADADAEDQPAFARDVERAVALHD